MAITNRKCTLQSIMKYGVKKVVLKCETDKKEWNLFAKHYKQEFFEYYYNSELNKKGTITNKLLFPLQFREKLHNIDTKATVSNNSNRTLKARQARWNNYSKDENASYSEYKPSLPLQHDLRNGKSQLIPMQGMALTDFKYVDKLVDIILELNRLLQDPKQQLLHRHCNCKNPRLKGWNSNSKVMTMECDIGCYCGIIYMHFKFGKNVKVSGKSYSETGLRFAALTQHCKVRFALGIKLELYFGMKMMDQRTYKKYKSCVNRTQKALSDRYMDEAIAEGTSDKLRHGTPTQIAMDGSYNTQGHGSNLGHNTTILRTHNIDPRTKRCTKVVHNYRRNRGTRYGQDHTASAGQIEVDGMKVGLRDLDKKGLPADILSHDLDTPTGNALKEYNQEYERNTDLGNDFNHTIKSGVGNALDSTKKKGKKIWRKAKSEDSSFTHKQAKKHKAIIYKWTSEILRRRKLQYQKGNVALSVTHFDDTRSELDGMLIHTCYAGDGHKLCQQNQYSKKFCKAAGDGSYQVIIWINMVIQHHIHVYRDIMRQ